jgi:hypothetical protein
MGAEELHYIMLLWAGTQMSHSTWSIKVQVLRPLVCRKCHVSDALTANLVVDEDAKTGLHLATQSGHLGVIKCLVKSLADTNGQGVSKSAGIPRAS